MKETSKGNPRPLLTIFKKAAANFLLVSIGAAGAGALYVGLCTAGLGLVHGECWNAAAAGSLRGASAGVVAGVLTATFDIVTSGRVAFVPIFSPKEHRHVDFSLRRGRSASRPFVPIGHYVK